MSSSLSYRYLTVTELNRKNETETKLLNGGEITRKMDDQFTDVSS